jgi:hypothetical protein
MNFREWLSEGSRWKDSNWKRPPTDASSMLKKYNSAGFYCHFSQMPDKLGINPKTAWEGTPYGIYAYEVNYVVSRQIRNVEWASNYPYIWIFKAKNPEKIKRIKRLPDRWEIDHPVEGDLNDAGLLWERVRSETKSDAAMSKWFLDRGIEGFVDEGTGTIYGGSEPHQAVFFGSQTILPLDVFRNVKN